MVKETKEEKSWSSYEKGFAEGYTVGTNDFEEVARIVRELRKKGIPVMKI